MKLRFALAFLLLLGACGLTGAGRGRSGDLIIHEWGTFLAMSGSDGVALDGMYHEEHALPRFVHARSRDQLRLPSVSLKGETPVIYFYTDRRQAVRVRVGFPRGIWTQWYPQAQMVRPGLARLGSPLDLRGGNICWNVEVVPGDAATLPATAPGALWNFARDVDAATVRVAGSGSEERERFLFYRGLGRAPLPLTLTADGGGTLALGKDGRHGVRHVFVVRVENGKGAYRYLPALEPGRRVADVLPPASEARPLAEFADRIGDDLARRLVESGLYPKEARAMVNTWRASYFETEGVRALFVLPQAWTDAFIPIEIRPAPRQVVRVMVGRTELLTPEREHRAREAVHDLAAPDAVTRERAWTFLREQGRYVEPILRRAERTSPDARVRDLCRRLLLTDFVTELRAAARSAADGTPTQEDPLDVRGQLAALLRQAGLHAEARAEAGALLADLRSRPAPPLTDPEARRYLRTYARAMEGLGDKRGAAERTARAIWPGSATGGPAPAMSNR